MNLARPVQINHVLYLCPRRRNPPQLTKGFRVANRRLCPGAKFIRQATIAMQMNYLHILTILRSVFLNIARLPVRSVVDVLPVWPQFCILSISVCVWNQHAVVKKLRVDLFVCFREISVSLRFDSVIHLLQFAHHRRSEFCWVAVQVCLFVPCPADLWTNTYTYVWIAVIFNSNKNIGFDWDGWEGSQGVKYGVFICKKFQFTFATALYPYEFRLLMSHV